MSSATLERVGKIARITLSNPRARNALTLEMGRDLLVILDSLSKEPIKTAPRVVEIRGDKEGRGLSSGRDLKASKDFRGDASKIGEYMRIARSSVWNTRKLPMPSVAIIDQLAIGWGAELAMACDFRVVREDSRIRFPETKLGLFPGAGGLPLLSKILGEARAKELIFRAEFVGANDALGKFYPLATHADSIKLAESLSSSAPLAVREAKAAIHHDDVVGGDLDDFLERASIRRDSLSFSKDHSEALAAFAENRLPEFSGE